MSDGKVRAEPSRPPRKKAASRDVRMPTIAEAAELFQESHLFHPPGSRSALNFRFTGRLNLIARRYRTRLNELLKRIGQTQARWDALFWISVSGDAVTQSELAERMGVEGPTLVRMLNRLEQEGLVERREAPTDRRAKIIHLTPAAEQVMSQIAELSGPYRDDILQDISAEELRVCLSVFDRLMTRLERD